MSDRHGMLVRIRWLTIRVLVPVGSGPRRLKFFCTECGASSIAEMDEEKEVHLGTYLKDMKHADPCYVHYAKVDSIRIDGPP